MPKTVQELATEFGVDLATVDPRFVAGVSEVVTAANTEFKTAKELRDASEANLRRVQEEQAEINEYIAQYGKDATADAALRANYAAMEAQLKSLKEQGVSVNVPESLAAHTTDPNKNKPTFDPDKFRGSVSSAIAQLTDLSNKHLALTGKPLPDGSEALAEEARKAGKSLYEYGAGKYDFAGKEAAQVAAASAAHDADVAAKAVADFKAKNPNNSADPNQRGGVESAFPTIQRKTMEAGDLSKFANMNPRQKIAASVARSREAIAAAQQ